MSNYIVKIGQSEKISYLLLCYTVNHEYCFVDLKKGKILDLTFSKVNEAEKWLYENSIVYEKNAIETTYVP